MRLAFVKLKRGQNNCLVIIIVSIHLGRVYNAEEMHTIPLKDIPSFNFDDGVRGHSLNCQFKMSIEMRAGDYEGLTI